MTTSRRYMDPTGRPCHFPTVPTFVDKNGHTRDPLWRFLPNWEYMYGVSEAGDVARGSHRTVGRKRLAGQLLKIYWPKDNFTYFNLKGVRLSLAGMVLTVFERPANPHEIPFHKDGNFRNCCITNLEWMDEIKVDKAHRLIYREMLTIRGRWADYANTQRG